MAKERGVADKECGISLRAWGWSGYKKRDAVICHKCGTTILPGGVSGTWDFPLFLVPLWKYETTIRVAVECKAGDTSIAFSALSAQQREWALSQDDRQKFLWLCMGKGAVNAVEKPRLSWLLPYEDFLYIERTLTAQGRKSVPYGSSLLEPFVLLWGGDQTWHMPPTHPCYWMAQQHAQGTD